MKLTEFMNSCYWRDFQQFLIMIDAEEIAIITAFQILNWLTRPILSRKKTLLSSIADRRPGLSRMTQYRYCSGSEKKQSEVECCEAEELNLSFCVLFAGGVLCHSMEFYLQLFASFLLYSKLFIKI